MQQNMKKKQKVFFIKGIIWKEPFLSRHPFENILLILPTTAEAEEQRDKTRRL
jgi:hypothetical protein